MWVASFIFQPSIWSWLMTFSPFPGDAEFELYSHYQSWWEKKKKKKVIRALSPFIFLSYDMMNESLLFFCRHRLQLSKLSQKKKNLIKFKSVWLRQGIYQRMGLSFSLSTVSHDPSTPDLTMLGWPAPPAWWGSIPLKLLSCDSHGDMPERGPK